MSKLFSLIGTDIYFKAIRNEERNLDLKRECEALWEKFSSIAEKDFICEFSSKFHERFWEMYLGVKLLNLYPDQVNSLKNVKGPKPDFLVGCQEKQVVVEATFASRGEDGNPDQIPDITKRTDKDDNSVPFQQCVLRLINAVQVKAFKNNLPEYGKTKPVIIAVNMPFPEVWTNAEPPLVAQAFLGANFLYFQEQSDGTWQRKISPQRVIEKSNAKKTPVPVNLFFDSKYQHISAVLFASIRLFSSTYKTPSFELLHNPLATHKLKEGWFPLGSEYQFVKNTLKRTDYF